MMKKFISALLVVMVMLSISMCAFADVAFEPTDGFYKSHANECTYLDISCYANGENGYVTIWKDPTANKAVANPVNGTVIYCACEYKGWYYVEYDNQNSHITGWAVASDFVEVYTGSSFASEYADKMITDTDEISKEFTEREATNDQYFFYTYPGSGEISSSLLTEYLTEDSLFFFDMVYEDEQGNLWGYINYFMGSRDSWMCISNPEDDNLPKVLDKTPELYPAKDIEQGATPATPEEAVPSAKTNVIVAVIAVCCILIAFISVYSKKKTKEARAAIRASEKKKNKKKK